MQGTKKIRDHLSPEWLRDCVMIDQKNHSVVISPKHFLEHGITNLVVAQGLFCAKSVLKMRFDYDIVKIKRAEAERNYRGV